MDSAIKRVQFALVATVVLISPWCFGAWEAWWFWPFLGLIFLAAALQGIRQLHAAVTGENRDERATSVPAAATKPLKGAAGTQRGVVLLLSLLPFLGYYFVRCWQVPVRMEGERALLLFLGSLVLACIILFGFTVEARRRLFIAILVNLFLLGVYGLINHLATGSQLVLWAEGYEQYYRDGRASGSFFCPDHFSGIMELALGIGVAVLLSRRSRRLGRLGAVLVISVAFVGVVLSKSRGGGMTLLVLAAPILVWGFASWPRPARKWWRLAVALAGLAVLVVCAHFATGYVTRFSSYFGVETYTRAAIREAVPHMGTRFRSTIRGRMFSAAYRAWQEHPWVGIGPGMHKIEWPRIAPSPDGNRETGKWPSQPNNTFSSSEVHNDWLQLLEEAGLIGLILFVIPALLGGLLLVCELAAACRISGDAAHRHEWVTPDAMVLGALLAVVAMGFHSLGDFNLQIPAVNWVFTAILALGFGSHRGARPHADRGR